MEQEILEAIIQYCEDEAKKFTFDDCEYNDDEEEAKRYDRDCAAFWRGYCKGLRIVDIIAIRSGVKSIVEPSKTYCQYKVFTESESGTATWTCTEYSDGTKFLFYNQYY